MGVTGTRASFDNLFFFYGVRLCDGVVCVYVRKIRDNQSAATISQLDIPHMIKQPVCL